MKDRYLVGSIAAGFVSLTAGVIGNGLHVNQLGVVAGVSGFAAAIFGVAIGARTQQTDHRLSTLRNERDQYRHELDSLASAFANDGHDAATLALAPSIGPETAVETTSGLLDQQFFTVLVQQRVAAARRHLQPIAIVIFDIDGIDRSDADECGTAMAALGDTVTRTLRESDAACRVGTTMAAAILEDTAEAGAVWAAERIRGMMAVGENGRDLTVSAGIACYPTHALSATELIDRAGRALDTARAHGRDRLEIATSD